jgi:hypothetical protein
MISLALGKTSNMRSPCANVETLQDVGRVCSSTASILIGRKIRFRSGEDDPRFEKAPAPSAPTANRGPQGAC